MVQHKFSTYRWIYDGERVSIKKSKQFWVLPCTMDATTILAEATAPRPPAAAQTNANIAESDNVPVALPNSAPIENTLPSPGFNQLNINLFAAPSDGELINGLQLEVEANIDNIELGDTLSYVLGMTPVSRVQLFSKTGCCWHRCWSCSCCWCC